MKQIAAQFVGPRTVHIFIGGVEEKLVANKAITQHVKVMSGSFEKLPELQVRRGRVRFIMHAIDLDAMLTIELCVKRLSVTCIST